MSGAVAIVVLTGRGLATARRIGACLGEARIHGYAPRVPDADVRFEDAGAELRRLFAAGVDVVGVCAAGILIRTLAPALADKHEEPAVVAVAEDGGAVVPLLGGHRGANALARRLGDALGVPAAVTTASETRWQVALDDPPPGWVLANPHHCKSFTARLLAGEPCRLEGEAEWLQGSGVELQADAARPPRDRRHRPRGSGAELQVGAALTVRVTDAPDPGDEDTLVFHRRRFALGVGCERGVAADELRDLVERTLAGAGLSARALAGVFSVDLKMDEPAVHSLAQTLGLPARFFAPPALEALTPRLANPSATVFREVGCHGVSEAAALAAAGAEGTLRVPKTRSKRATCAIGEAPSPIDAARLGQARGVLTVVGLGPGTPAWRTPAADRAVAAATHLVGYRGYLDLLPAGGRRVRHAHAPGEEAERVDRTLAAGGQVRNACVSGEEAARVDRALPAGGQVRHAYALGEETERVDRALALAAGGHRVALICSGDPGVYAMAALVFERLEMKTPAHPDWRRSEIVVLPGVSAMHGAAALAGAPLGHDFCAISLSDLLTPWAVIEGRLEAAAAGDFVVALYNPASSRRRRGLARAVEILAAKRPAATPVVVARSIGREGQKVTVTSLQDLDQSSIDMMTLLIVGSTATRAVGGQVYTPRGYGRKDGPETGA